ncbi:MAG TPA: UDP-N-acetylmuramate dehydrogenase [Gemmatimonadota bacterium]|nr:UDP-N-acetylmuramate dehydrogenase [Gemmatimonadota bacterium]
MISVLPAACRRDVPLAPLTYCKIGGVARVFCEARSEADVAEAVEWHRAEGGEAFVLGGGANVLIDDSREHPLVLKLSEHYNAIEMDGSGGRARIEAGIYTPRLVREAWTRGWEGFQFLAGVPGSLGGAVRMNAGIRELSTWNLVEEVEGITWEGERVRIGRAEARPTYRSGNLPPDLIVTAVVCRIVPGEPEAIRAAARELSRSRRDTQPLQHPSWGSTFKNPSGASSTGRTAGALIEAAGLKGFRAGDAQISEKHANFVINLGEASSADALACIRAAHQGVLERFGVRLEPEVRLIGFAPGDLAFLEAES